MSNFSSTCPDTRCGRAPRQLARGAATAAAARRGGGTWIAVMGHSKPILCDYCEFFIFAGAFHNDVTILSQNNSKFSNVVRLLWVVSQGVFTENSQIPHNHTVNFLRLWNVCEMFRNDFLTIISHQFEVYCFLCEFFVKSDGHASQGLFFNIVSQSSHVKKW